MFYFVLGLHLFLCVVLVTLVLLQQGKGASVGAVFSGSSNTLFGATGANTVLTKVTTGVAVAFMVTSIILVRLYAGHASARIRTGSPLEGSVLVGQTVEAPAAVPADEAPKSAESAVSSVGVSSVAAPVAAQASSVDASAAAVVPAPQQDNKPESAAAEPEKK